MNKQNYQVFFKDSLATDTVFKLSTKQIFLPLYKDTKLTINSRSQLGIFLFVVLRLAFLGCFRWLLVSVCFLASGAILLSTGRALLNAVTCFLLKKSRLKKISFIKPTLLVFCRLINDGLYLNSFKSPQASKI